MRIIFRAFRNNGEVIALLPDLPANPGHYVSYMHVGQHGEAGAHLEYFTRLATPEEYAPLLRELQQIYSPELLVIHKRLTKL